jgi:hypothetical protein
VVDVDRGGGVMELARASWEHAMSVGDERCVLRGVAHHVFNEFPQRW